MVARRYLFTSESVSEGHPDKLCDQISDAILDACLSLDPHAKVACETATKTNLIMVFGEISMNGTVDYESVIRQKAKEIGYDDEAKGLDYRTMKVIVALEEQSPEIAAGVHINKTKEDIGAGDQGLVFGFACNETSECMPLTHYLSSQLAMRLAECRKTGVLPWLRPDGKTQVTVDYMESEDGNIVPIRVNTIIISAQHAPGITNTEIEDALRREVINPVVPKKYLDENTLYYLNPSGSFIVGGPHGDAGLTGRKIIVDTYGGWGGHGGGAFSGKDSTKVDRSAAYGARWAARSLVENGFCDRVTVQISYAIGVSKPVSMCVNSHRTVKHGLNDNDLEAILERNFDFRPGCLIEDLGLNRPIFSRTAAYGHFGRPEFSWETSKDLSNELKQ